MKILIIAPEPLFPTNGGGREDPLRFARGLLAMNHEVSVICFTRETAETESPVGQFNKYLISVRKNLLSSTLKHPFLPFQISSRQLSQELLENLDGPFDCIVAFQEWSLPAARLVSQIWEAPIALRRQNDEKTYYWSLARAERSWLKKIYLVAEALRISLMGLSERSLRGTSFLMDIASTRDDDEVRIPKIVLPPVLFENFRPRAELKQPNVFFVGSLDVAHTLEGISWFVTEVWPKIIASVPEAQLLIAGRGSESPEVIRRLSGRNIKLLGEVVSIDPYLKCSSIFVNPIHGGSGVNMKMGPPASAGLPIVTTTLGLRGLEHLEGSVVVGDSPDDFSARAIELLLSLDMRRSTGKQVRRAVQNYSEKSAASSFLNTLKKQVHK